MLVFYILYLTKLSFAFIIILVLINGDVAQLARANGSYPLGQRFESTHRYHTNINDKKHIYIDVFFHILIATTLVVFISYIYYTFVNQILLF